MKNIPGAVTIPTQTDLIQKVVLRVTLNARNPVVEVGEAIDEALRVDKSKYGGQVFHQGETPRASARRALYEVLDASVLLIKDGRGQIRFRPEALRNAILQGDAWDILKLIPDSAVGCIIADAPNTSLDEHRAIGKATRITNGQYFETKDLDLELIREFYRVLSPGSYCFLYMPPMAVKSVNIWKQVLDAVLATEFEVIRQPAWDKMRRGMGYRFTMQTEPILVLGKKFRDGRLPDCADRTITDLLQVPALRGDQRTPYTDFGAEEERQWQEAEQKYGGRGEIPREIRKSLPGKYHETEKPADLARLMLRVARKPGELLLEVFAGSGHACVVAHEFGMPYVAVEYSERAVRRLLAPRLQKEGRAPETIIEVTK